MKLASILVIILIGAVAAAAISCSRFGASDAGGGGLPTVVVVRPGFVGQTPPVPPTPQTKRGTAVLDANTLTQRAITLILLDPSNIIGGGAAGGASDAAARSLIAGRTHTQLSTYGSLPLDEVRYTPRFVSDYPVWVVTIAGPFGGLPLSASVPPGFVPPIYDKAIYYFDAYDGTQIAEAWVPNAASEAALETAQAKTVQAKPTVVQATPTPQ